MVKIFIGGNLLQVANNSLTIQYPVGGIFSLSERG